MNLINLFNFYLAVVFVLGLWVRSRQYASVVALVRAVPGRWPRLFRLIGEHRHIFLTWATLLPGFLYLGLMLVQFAASMWVWPEAGRPPNGLTLFRMGQHLVALPFVLAAGMGMVGVDFYTLATVGKVDRPLLEKYFDQAEYWLRSWTAPVVRVFTLGYVNPRKMVAEEVQKALVGASQILHTSLWWTCMQMALRIAFGLTIWLTFALGQQAG